MSVVGSVFGNIGTTKPLNRFSLRGKKKVRSQWQLYCLVHNMRSWRMMVIWPRHERPRAR
ncbi:transposase [Vreelandella alkaliphila]|uniref:transposase n=1 Tax=Halomonadaceae TaxID=28256 RepID=UPI000E91C063|nr:MULTISPECIES: transposase [unclassified Halomonas]HBS83153.1 hypothetical protein [Halomonas campaniensis]